MNPLDSFESRSGKSVSELSPKQLARDLAEFCLPNSDISALPLQAVHLRVEKAKDALRSHPSFLESPLYRRLGIEVCARLPETIEDRAHAHGVHAVLDGLNFGGRFLQQERVLEKLRSIIVETLRSKGQEAHRAVEPLVRLIAPHLSDNPIDLSAHKIQNSEQIQDSQSPTRTRTHPHVEQVLSVTEKIINSAQKVFAEGLHGNDSHASLAELLEQREHFKGAKARLFNSLIDQHCMEIVEAGPNSKIYESMEIFALQAIKQKAELFTHRPLVRAFMQQLSDEVTTWHKDWGNHAGTPPPKDEAQYEKRVGAALVTLSRINMIAAMLSAFPVESAVDLAAFGAKHQTELHALTLEAIRLALPYEQIELQINQWGLLKPKSSATLQIFQKGVIQLLEDGDISRFPSNAARLNRLIPENIRKAVFKAPTVIAAMNAFVESQQKAMSEAFSCWLETQNSDQAVDVLQSAQAASALFTLFWGFKSVTFIPRYEPSGIFKVVSFQLEGQSKQQKNILTSCFEATPLKDLEGQDSDDDSYEISLSSLLSTRIEALCKFEDRLQDELFKSKTALTVSSSLIALAQCQLLFDQLVEAQTPAERTVYAIALSGFLLTPAAVIAFGEPTQLSHCQFAAQLNTYAQESTPSAETETEND